MPKDSTKRQPHWTSCWTTTTRPTQMWSASRCATTARRRAKRRYFIFSPTRYLNVVQVWKFKGSIFLTFKTEDAAKAFVAKEEKYKEETLLKKFQKDYLEEKKKEMEEKKNKYQKKDKKPKSEGADGKEEVMTSINPKHKISY